MNWEEAYFEREKLGEKRKIFYSCQMGENESVGSYLTRIIEALREARNAGITDIMAARHLIAQLPNEWAAYAEQIRSYQEIPMTNQDDKYVCFGDLAGSLFTYWAMHGKPPADITTFSAPRLIMPDIPYFGADNRSEIFPTWTYPPTSEMLPPTIHDEPGPSYCPIHASPPPYPTEPIPFHAEQPGPNMVMPEYHQFMESPFQPPYSLSLPSIEPFGYEPRRDLVLEMPPEDAQMFGPIPPDVDFAGRLPSPPSPSMRRSRATARMSTIQPVKVMLSAPEKEGSDDDKFEDVTPPGSVEGDR